MARNPNSKVSIPFAETATGSMGIVCGMRTKHEAHIGAPLMPIGIFPNNISYHRGYKYPIKHY